MTVLLRASASPLPLVTLVFFILASCHGQYYAKVERLHVSTTIRCRYAVTTIESRLYNSDGASQEALFRVVLPETAVISNFSVATGDKKYVGRVEEKNAAQKKYERAKNDGELGVIIRQSPRFTNSFQIFVNVESGSKADFVLVYEELLVRRLGAYNLLINVNPGQIVEDLQVVVSIDETRPLEFVHVSGVETTDLIPLPGKRKKENEVATVRQISPNQALVTYSPNVEEQERASFASGIGRLRVTYDVDHVTDGGEIQVGGDHFVHFFAPTNLPYMAKHVTFVLDVSGSMTKRHKLYEVKDAMRKILRELDETDHLSIIAFADGVHVWSGDGDGGGGGGQGDDDDDDGKPAAAVSAPATTDNVNSAINFINGLRASGATNIYDALEKALNDVYESRNRRGNSNVKPDLIFFLTDGRPTVGKFIKEDQVLHQLKRVNYRNDVIIHSLGFGDDVNSDFLERLSLMNGGLYRKIHVAPDASLQLDQFYKEVSTPLMSNLDFQYSLPGIDDGFLTATEFHLLYDGAEIVVAGRFKGGEKSDRDERSRWNESSSLEHSVRGSVVGTSATTSKLNFPIQFPRPTNSVTISSTSNYGTSDKNFIERLWAHMMVNQMIKEHKSVENKWLSRRLKAEALEMALKYQFVTPLTAMVVTKPSSNKIGLLDDEIFTEPRRKISQESAEERDENDENDEDNLPGGDDDDEMFQRNIEPDASWEENKLSEKRDLKRNEDESVFAVAASRQLDDEGGKNHASSSRFFPYVLIPPVAYFLIICAL